MKLPDVRVALNLLSFLVVATIIVVPIAALILTPSTSNLTDDLNDTSSTAIAIASLTLAVGFLTMALVEATRRLLPIRGWVQAHLFNQIVGVSTDDTQSPADRVTSARAFNPKTARRDRPSTVAWFDVPVEQLTAQIEIVADKETSTIIESLRATDFVQQLTLGIVSLLLGFPSNLDFAVWAAIQAGKYETDSKNYLREISADDPDARLRELESTLTTQIELELNYIQRTIGDTWRRFVRLSACIIASLITAAILIVGDSGFLLVLFTSVAIGVLGGFFSWVARDLLAIIERQRR